MIAAPQPEIVTQERAGATRRRALPYHLAAVVIVAAGVGLRLWIIGRGLPLFDSDEGTMGLMALHINAGSDHPIFLYGQAYMGSIEAYLAAPVFHLLGASDSSLRLPLILLASLFLGLLYTLSALLYGVRVAILSVLITSLGSSELLARQLKADGGYPELLVFGTSAMLGASYLAMTAGEQPPYRWRTAIFGIWGLTLGLGIWSDPLMLPFALMSTLLLLVTCRPLRRPAVIVALLGLLLGLAPMLDYNVMTPPSGGTAATILSIVRSGGSGHTGGGPSPLPQRGAGLLAVSIPVMTGGNGLCSLPPQDAWPITGHSSPHTLTCTVVHAGWGAGWLLCWALAVMGAFRASLRAMRRRLEAQPPTALHLARLALLGSAGLTVFLFMLTPAPAHAPWFNVRYLTGIWIALPAILAVLLRSRHLADSGRTRHLPGYGVIVLACTVLAGNLIGTYGNAGYATWLHAQMETTATSLRVQGVRHVYADYWTCDWLAFETKERITCAVIDARQRPALDRYRPYRAAVQRDRAALYIFRADSREAVAFARMAGNHPGRYRRVSLPAFTVYQRIGT